MDNVAVLIPCYNEAVTIEKVVKDFKKALPDSVIYVYDNCSTDETASIAEKAGAVVRKENLQGKGNVIRRMFREIDAKCYVMVDGDDTYPATAAPEMVKAVLEKNADMVVGDRLSSTYFEENKRPFHNIGNSMVKKAINMIFKSNIKDIMTGYRAFGFDFVKTFPVLSKGFEIETEMTIHAIDKNMSCENVVIEYRDRPDGSDSKLNTYSDGFKVLRTIGRLFREYKPLAFYGLISLLLTVISLAMFIPAYISKGASAHLTLYIICAIMFIVALFCFFAGLILDTVKQKSHRDFEMQLEKTNDRYKDLLK